MQNKKKLGENCYDFHDTGILGANEGPDDEKSILLFSLLIIGGRPAIIVDKLDQTNHRQVLMIVTLLRLLSLMTPARPLGNK